MKTKALPRQEQTTGKGHRCRDEQKGSLRLRPTQFGNRQNKFRLRSLLRTIPSLDFPFGRRPLVLGTLPSQDAAIKIDDLVPQLHQLLSSRRAATATATIDSHSLLLRELGGRLLLEVIGIEIYEQSISNMPLLIFLFRAHVQQLHCGRVADKPCELFRRDSPEPFIAMRIHSPSSYNNYSKNDRENDFRIHNMILMFRKINYTRFYIERKNE